MSRRTIENTRELISTLKRFGSRREVAEQLDISLPTLYNWERGKKASYRYLGKFERALDAAYKTLKKEGWEVDQPPIPRFGRAIPTGGRLATVSYSCRAEIQDLLKGGPKPAKEVLKVVKKRTSASYQTIQKAARSLKIVRTHEGFGPSSVWYWELPVDEDDDQE